MIEEKIIASLFVLHNPWHWRMNDVMLVSSHQNDGRFSLLVHNLVTINVACRLHHLPGGAVEPSAHFPLAAKLRRFMATQSTRNILYSNTNAVDVSHPTLCYSTTICAVLAPFTIRALQSVCLRCPSPPADMAIASSAPDGNRQFV